MTNQDNSRDHEWITTYEDHSPAHKFIRYEECTKCGAARVTELPSGDLIGIELPEGTYPDSCPSDGQKESPAV